MARLWTHWGGEEVSQANWQEVYCGLSATGPDFFEGSMHLHLPNANKVLVHVLLSAVKKAQDICDGKKCDCRRIIVSFVQIDKNGEVVDPSKSDDGVPKMPRQITITCPKG